ncbi:MAG: hypothetical protein L6Q72_09310, partial [Burkholderiaceae bacterium]|nr:hypothetical protein [Burkholderiaceae bacterium]
QKTMGSATHEPNYLVRRRADLHVETFDRTDELGLSAPLRRHRAFTAMSAERSARRGPAAAPSLQTARMLYTLPVSPDWQEGLER